MPAPPGPDAAAGAAAPSFPGRLANLDLNLLLSLRALLVERNVTRAAAALGLSQPAVSAALARLRRHFGDELLVRVGNRYELTPLALRLVDRAESAVAGIERVFSAGPRLRPRGHHPRVHPARLGLRDDRLGPAAGDGPRAVRPVRPAAR